MDSNMISVMVIKRNVKIKVFTSRLMLLLLYVPIIKRAKNVFS